MFELESPWLAFQGFFDAGGSVLWAIFFATMLMWTMIVERLWFLRTHHSGNVERAQAEWSGAYRAGLMGITFDPSSAHLRCIPGVEALCAPDPGVDGIAAVARAAWYRDRDDPGVQRDGICRHDKPSLDGRRGVGGNYSNHVRPGCSIVRSLVRCVLLEKIAGRDASNRRAP